MPRFPRGCRPGMRSQSSGAGGSRSTGAKAARGVGWHGSPAARGAAPAFSFVHSAFEELVGKQIVVELFMPEDQLSADARVPAWDGNPRTFEDNRRKVEWRLEGAYWPPAEAGGVGAEPSETAPEEEEGGEDAGAPEDDMDAAMDACLGTGRGRGEGRAGRAA